MHSVLLTYFEKSLNRRVCFNFDERLVRTIVGPKHETYEAILSMLAKRPRRDARVLFSKKVNVFATILRNIFMFGR